MAPRHRTLVVAATTILAVLSALLAPIDIGRAAAADDVMTFWSLEDVAMTKFQVARTSRAPAWLDWSSDGCSTTTFGPGNTGRSFNFRKACQRHDFGYRNLHLLERRLGAPTGTHWNHDTRLRADQRFLADMRADCAPRPWTQRVTCRAWARTYYEIVRRLGGP